MSANKVGRPAAPSLIAGPTSARQAQVLALVDDEGGYPAVCARRMAFVSPVDIEFPIDCRLRLCSIKN